MTFQILAAWLSSSKRKDGMEQEYLLVQDVYKHTGKDSLLNYELKTPETEDNQDANNYIF